MKTGVFIRAEVDGRWDNYDIGDSRLPDSVVAKWINAQSEGGIGFLKRLAMILLGRDPTAIT